MGRRGMRGGHREITSSSRERRSDFHLADGEQANSLSVVYVRMMLYIRRASGHTHTNVIARASRLFPVSASPPAFPPFFTAGALIPHRRPGISVRILELNQTTGRNQDEGRGLVAFLDFYILARHLLTAQSLQQQQQQQQEENNAE